MKEPNTDRGPMKVRPPHKKWLLLASAATVITCVATMQIGLFNPYRLARRLPVILGMREDTNLTYLEGNLSDIDEVYIYTVDGQIEIVPPQRDLLINIIRHLGPTHAVPETGFREIQFTINGEMGLGSLSLSECSEEDRKALEEATNHLVVPMRHNGFPGVGPTETIVHPQSALPPPKV